MPICVVAEQEINVGTAEFVDGTAPDCRYAVVFEDDGETGYLYALDRSLEEQPILDAMHIYNVANVSDRHLPSRVTIGWSPDNLKVVLLINKYPHAVYDFESKHGYCRTGFPPPSKDGGWSGHAWDDSVGRLFAEKQ